MDQKMIFKQMIAFNKASFDNTLNAMKTLQDQSEQTFNSYLDQASWLPGEGKKAINEWMTSYKKGCEDFRKTVDENYKKVEDFFNSMT